MAKVLILDKSKSLRSTLRERLEHEHILSESADDESQAAKLCDEIEFDLILSESENRIPDCEVPFVVLSREASVESAILALRNGALDYLPSPIDMNRLLTSIRSLAEEREQDDKTVRPLRRRAVAITSRIRATNIAENA